MSKTHFAASKALADLLKYITPEVHVDAAPTSATGSFVVINTINDGRGDSVDTIAANVNLFVPDIGDGLTDTKLIEEYQTEIEDALEEYGGQSERADYFDFKIIFTQMIREKVRNFLNIRVNCYLI